MGWFSPLSRMAPQPPSRTVSTAATTINTKTCFISLLLLSCSWAAELLRLRLILCVFLPIIKPMTVCAAKSILFRCGD